MKTRMIVILVLVVMVSVIYAQESDQVRVILNFKRSLNDNNSLYFRFVIPNLVDDFHPNAWFGVNKKFSENFSLGIMAGKTMKKEENTNIVSVFPVFNFGKLCLWNEIDYNVSPKKFYNYTEVRYTLFDWLKVGLDNENLSGEFFSIAPAIDIMMKNNMAISFNYFWKWMDSERQRYFRFYLKFF